MPRLTLYHTLGCHLCEEAQALLAQSFAAHGIDPACLRLADIAEDEALLERYGILIPVLREDATGRELHWPFGLDDIREFTKGVPQGGACAIHATHR